MMSIRSKMLLVMCLTVGWTLMYSQFALVGDDSWEYAKKYAIRPRPKTVSDYAIDTEGCQIPFLDPFDRSFRRFDAKHRPPPLKCDQPQLFYAEGKTLRANWPQWTKFYEKHKDAKCVYLPIVRVTDDHSDFVLPPRPVHDGMPIEHEFVTVLCYVRQKYVYRDFFASIVPKPEVESRCDRASRQRSGLDKMSVILLGLDSVSKSQYLRHLVRTDKLIREKSVLIEFRGYNQVGFHTIDNMIPMNTGKHLFEFGLNVDNKSLDSLPFVWNEFARRGYRTLFAEDATRMATFNFFRLGFERQPTDYYMRPFALAVERCDLYKRFVSRGCYRNRTESSVALGWMLDFFDQFRGQPLFAYVFLSRMTHDKYTSVANQDRDFAGALDKLHQKGHLNNTVVFLFSDHGFHFTDLKLTYEGHLDSKLPFLFALLPRWFPRKYSRFYRNLKLNENRLVTVFDVHSTLVDIADSLRKVKNSGANDRRVSLLAAVPPSRNCRTAGIDDLDCACTGTRPIALDGDVARNAAFILLEQIKSIIVDAKRLCADLELDKIIDANVQVIRQRDESTFNVIYEMTIRVAPSRAIFQGIVRFDGLNQVHTASERVDRLNLYANQSDCVESKLLKPFCYCLNDSTNHL